MEAQDCFDSGLKEVWESHASLIFASQTFGGEREVWELRSHAFPLHYTPGLRYFMVRRLL